MKIVVLDGYGLNPGDLSWEAIRELGDVTVYDRTPAELILQRAADADVILTNKVPLTAETLAQLPRLKYVGVLATGYNVVEIQAASAQGVTVTNIPSYSTDSVAQIVFAHILNILNRVGYYAAQNADEQRWCKSPDFCYWDSPIHELAGMTIGIVGFGHIGQAVARIAHAFGMKVLLFTSKSAESLPEGMTKVANLDQLLRESDIVTLHCPLTPDTQHMIDETALSKMKPSAILINTGRGPLIDEEAVAKALNTGRIHAAGVDVLSTEPPLPGNPLLTAKNCFITPHIAWATVEARQRLMKIAADNIKAFLAGAPVNAVN
jgi:glycerate dehydrogenase